MILNTKEEGMLPCPAHPHPRPPLLHLPFLENKKCPEYVHCEVKYIIQSIYLRVSGTKSSKVFRCRTLFPWFFEKMFYRSALISRNLPCLEQLLIVHLHIYHISNLIFLHWNCIGSIYRNLGGLVVWYLKRWPGFDSQPGSLLPIYSKTSPINDLCIKILKHIYFP